MRIILNFIKDTYFTDDIIRCHDMASDGCKHIYVLVDPLFSRPDLRYIKQNQRVMRVKSGNVKYFIKQNKADAIFLHGLFSMPLSIIHEVPKDIKVFWFSWGYDIYGNDNISLVKMPLFHEKTQEAISIINKSFNKRIKNALTYIPHKIKESFIYHFYIKAVSRIDYYSGVLPIEYSLCSQSPYFKAQEVRYSYFPFEIFSEFNNHTFHRGNNILIGNSADMKNNHLDILPYLKNASPFCSNFILPLSYCEENKYKKIVTQEYSNALGKNLVVIKDFLPIDEYVEILHGCKAGIFFHERQQGMGTIMMLLVMGCKVFLSETSVVYKHFCSIGVKVYSVQTELTYSELNNELSEEDRLENLKRLNLLNVKQLYQEYMENIYNCIP